ncbi:hypothetical protein [Massilia cavernae]|uniref:hypothetical protein n=1 Tax=Massilia cavernae TaxID=2320864 RepID=UPI0015FEE73C|nr:hypothetical protein [Massilia cavernae]
MMKWLSWEMHELNHTQIAQRLDQLTELSVALGNSPDIGTLLDLYSRSPNT